MASVPRIEERGSRRSTVSDLAVAKSGRVLYAFSHFYLPFYGRAPADVFWMYDPIAWISAFIYDVDEDVESGADAGPGVTRLDELRGYLAERLRVDAPIERLFDDARRYYRFEQRIRCRDVEYTLDELEAIARARSFDFRVMHRALSQRQLDGYREELFDWFLSFELLMEIEDDAASIRVDADRNTFNILWLAERHSGPGGVEHVAGLRAQCEREARERLSGFSAGDRAVAERVLAAYRAVVPEPALDAHALREAGGCGVP